MLDIVEEALNDAGVASVRLDGQTPIAERQPLVDRFNLSNDINVFLLSTRAGQCGKFSVSSLAHK
jgi:SNF2 family DNA or RNA helicase